MYKAAQYECSCGMKFRTYTAEARHRHNFPVFCRRPKLSPRQEKALKKFANGEVLTAYEAQESLATLRALVKKGKLKNVPTNGLGAMFSPQTHIKFTKA